MGSVRFPRGGWSGWPKVVNRTGMYCRGVTVELWITRRLAKARCDKDITYIPHYPEAWAQLLMRPLILQREQEMPLMRLFSHWVYNPSQPWVLHTLPCVNRTLVCIAVSDWIENRDPSEALLPRVRSESLSDWGRRQLQDVWLGTLQLAYKGRGNFLVVNVWKQSKWKQCLSLKRM